MPPSCHTEEKGRTPLCPSAADRPEDPAGPNSLPFPGIDPVKVTIERIEMVSVRKNDQTAVPRVVSGKKYLSGPGGLYPLTDRGSDVDSVMKGPVGFNDLPAQGPEKPAFPQNGRMSVDLPSAQSMPPVLKPHDQGHELPPTLENGLVVGMDRAFLFLESGDLLPDVRHLPGETRLLCLLVPKEGDLPVAKCPKLIPTSFKVMLLVSVPVNKSGQPMGLVGEKIGVNDRLGIDVDTVDSRKGLLGLPRKKDTFKRAFLPEVGGNDRVEMFDRPLNTSDRLSVLDLPDLEAFDLQLELLRPDPKGKDSASELVSPPPDPRNASLVLEKTALQRLHFLLAFGQLTVDGVTIRLSHVHAVGGKNQNESEKKREKK